MASTLIEKTRALFPKFQGKQIEIREIERGGSDRNFFRLTVGDADAGESLILARYGTAREENRHYVAIAQFLHKIGVRVPEIYHHEEPILWMEDLGDRDLWSFRDKPWPIRRELYQRTLDQVHALHAHAMQAHAALGAVAPKIQPPFDADYYGWEQSYFFDNCLGRYFQIPEERLAAEGCREELAAIAARLAALPRCFVHRDFQSQNVVVKNGQPCLIDFQGMRAGLPQYDLASLLLDPYVQLDPAERDELLDYYMDLAGVKNRADFLEIYHLCALQRLMQALGAYGFLGLVRERIHFLQHIPTALASLRENMTGFPALAPLAGLLAGLKG